MALTTLDWLIVFASLLISLGIGLYASRSSGKDGAEFFLSGRNMPWWLLGVSMVATTFGADTPNLVTQLVREDGVAGNWVWWAFLLTGMLTTFVYARLWRRSGVTTDLEFYEIRYSGRIAGFLRGFRAVYLGVIFNVIVMGTVCLAGVKLGAALLGLTAVQTLLITSVITVAYSAFGGLRGVILTDFFQFGLAMVGSVGAAIFVLDMPEIGGLEGLLSHENVVAKIPLVPDFGDPSRYVPLMLVPLAVQWWASWYPGAEPGGGGYIAQRMLAAKSEGHALGATFFFNVAHYAVRPWPWILVALASLVLYPETADLASAFPDLPASQVQADLGYPIMLRLLPSGLLGIMVASLTAALMSTLSTHLNWGSSYLVNDVYLRFVKPGATDAEQVTMGRITTVGLMALALVFALLLDSALSGFNILLQIGAGTGLIFILRWLWWRINAYSELAGMVISFLVAVYFAYVHEALGLAPLEGHVQLLIGVGVTTVGWLAVTFATQPTDPLVLQSFVRRVRPPMMGWGGAATVDAYAWEGSKMSSDGIATPKRTKFGLQLSAAALGAVMVYGTLFGFGYWLYGEVTPALVAALVAVVSGLGVYALVKRGRV